MKPLLQVALLTIASLFRNCEAHAQTWALTSAPATNWVSLASSADGTRIAAAVQGGGIYLSTNSGINWVPTTVPVLIWQSIAASADGAEIVAASSDGVVFISTDGGVTWSQNVPAPLVHWASIAISGNGMRLVGVTRNMVPPEVDIGIYISTNGAATWQLLPNSYAPYEAVAASADGSTFAAVGFWWDVESFGPADCVTTNWGQSFTRIYPQAIAPWTAVACSSRGAKMLAASCAGFGLWSSTDHGTTWLQTPAPLFNCSSVAMSAEGEVIIAAEGPNLPGGVYTSTDFGATWISNSVPLASWSCVASSADGNKLLAAINGGGIYILNSTAHPILNIANAGRNIILSWVVPSTPCALEESADLNSWSPLLVDPILNSASLRYEANVVAAGNRKFFRLISQRPVGD